MLDVSGLTLFEVSEPVPRYWQVIYANPPINLLNSTTIVERAVLVERIEQKGDLNVVVFTSRNPDFFTARYDLDNTGQLSGLGVGNYETYFIRL